MSEAKTGDPTTTRQWAWKATGPGWSRSQGSKEGLLQESETNGLPGMFELEDRFTQGGEFRRELGINA